MYGYIVWVKIMLHKELKDNITSVNGMGCLREKRERMDKREKLIRLWHLLGDFSRKK